jgi:tetratricopeptide (TPR) repeat protein
MAFCLRLHAERQQGPGATVTGEVVELHGTVPAGLTIEVYDPRQGATISAPIMANGSFELRNLQPGNYQVRITNMHGQVIQQDFMAIDSGIPLSIELRQPHPTPRATGTISARRLLHHVPSQAQKEAKLAEKASQHGKTEEAIQHWQNAVQIDPEYMEAHNNLGVRYLYLKKYEEAAREFNKAVELEPALPQARANLSVALMALENCAEAEDAARHAVQLDPSYTKGRYTLGLVLMAERKYTEEALENLKKSAGQFPRAHVLAAEILAERGELPGAIEELRAYLKSGLTENRRQVEARLAELEQRETGPAGAAAGPTGIEEQNENTATR